MTADVGDVDRPLLAWSRPETSVRSDGCTTGTCGRTGTARCGCWPRLDLMDDVVQPVFLDVWTFAARFDGERGTVRGGASGRCGGWRYGTPTTTSTSARRWRGRTAGG